MKKLKKMKLTNKYSLQQLTREMPVMDVLDLAVIIGGGDGSIANPYSESEADSMIDNGTFAGGYVKDAGGNVSFWMGAVTIWGSNGYGSDEGYTGGGYSATLGANPLSAYFFLPISGVYDYASQWENLYPFIPNYSNQETGNNFVNMNDTENFDQYLTSWLGTVNTGIGAGAGNTQLGSNGKLYFETKTGRVFYGNQYVGTTSLQGLSKIAGRIFGTANLYVAGYNIMDAYQNEGTSAALETGGEELGGTVGASIGGTFTVWGLAKAGALFGMSVGPEGMLIGGIAGAIIGSLGGSWVGGQAANYIIEITEDK